MGLITGSATATILSGQTLSAAFYVGDKVPLTLQMPGTFTGTSVSFQGSEDGVTYQPIYSGNALYSENVTAAKDCNIDGGSLAPFPFLKIVSGTPELGDRLIVVISRAAGR